ncbi:hypothetical protein ABIE89_000457 [Bradyrhizobium niftali]
MAAGASPRRDVSLLAFMEDFEEITIRKVEVESFRNAVETLDVLALV